jgi:hypothetical protein
MDHDQSMGKLTFTILTILATALLPFASGSVASADAPSGSRLPIQMPLDATFRTCDGKQLGKHVASNQFGRAFAEVTTPGNNVSAVVTLATAVPDMQYNVRLIQVPRSTLACGPGDPGVIAASFVTDATGAGGVTVQGPIQSGTTGVWVFLDRPAAHSQTPAEFYTSTFVAAV